MSSPIDILPSFESYCITLKQHDLHMIPVLLTTDFLHPKQSANLGLNCGIAERESEGGRVERLRIVA